MAKGEQLELGSENNIQKSYTCDDTVFIDESLVRKIKRKAIRMQGQLSLHFAGVHYQQCMEELGLWDIGKESTK